MDPRTVARDAGVLLGVSLISAGAWMLSHPWGLIVSGIAILGVSVLLARSE